MEDITPALVFDSVSFAFEKHAPLVLHDVNFSVLPKSFTTIVGASGGGKSTVLKLVAGIERPLSGTVTKSLRTRMIFQSAALLPWLSVLENVLLGLADVSLKRQTKVRKAMKVIEELGLTTHLQKTPRELSGGQRQRVGIARALVSDPAFLLLDEPFSALDIETAGKLADDMLRIREERGITMLMVSHSIEDAVLLSDEVLVCSGGTISKHVPIPLSRPRTREAASVRTLISEIRALIPEA